MLLANRKQILSVDGDVSRALYDQLVCERIDGARKMALLVAKAYRLLSQLTRALKVAYKP